MRIQAVNVRSTATKKSMNQVNFRSVSIPLVLLVAKQGPSVVKGRKNVKYIEELQKCLNSYDSDKFIAGVNALSKTPDVFFDEKHQGWTDIMDLLTAFRSNGQDLMYIPELRFSALKKISSIPDTSYTNIQTKKDFINTFFDNGHEISNVLVKKFAELSDSIYSTFKIEILSKCFSSTRYNNIRKRRLDVNNSTRLIDYDVAKTPCEESAFPGHLDKKVEISYNNLAMLATLDKNIYKSYYSHIRPMINSAKSVLEVRAYSEPHSNLWNFRERMISDYENNIKPL